MSKSMFDPDAFLDSFVEGANETDRVLIPAGVYPAYVESVDMRHGERESDGSPWVMLVLKYVIESEEAASALNRDKIVLTDSMFIDLNDEGQIAIGTNKNVMLGKLRAATDLNTGRFSPRDLVGHRLLLSIAHKVNKDTGIPREEVKSFAHM
jgi:hypothetical protein